MKSTQGDTVLRRLNADDARAMHSLERQCFSLPWSEIQCTRAFEQKAFAAFGLWQMSQLIAYISIYHIYDEFEILNIAVHPSERGKGHGRHILQMALQIALKMGMKSVVLEVRRSNFKAISLYESCGFILSGTRPRYYPDNNEDALIFVYTPTKEVTDSRSPHA